MIKPTTQCVKVASLRKESGNVNINLETWISNPVNEYVGRRGRIFIHYIDANNEKAKRVFHYPESKWKNPYKVGEANSLSTSLELYEKHIESDLVEDLKELSGKNLGCFCDQKGDCHAKVLVRLFESYVLK